MLIFLKFYFSDFDKLLFFFTIYKTKNCYKNHNNLL
jgi:hypothetical protein